MKLLPIRARLGDPLEEDINSGLPILPLDGLTYHAKPNSDVQFRAIDFDQPALGEPPVKEPFAPDDRMALWIKTKWNAAAEVIHTDKKGRKRKLSDGDKDDIFECDAGHPTRLASKKGIRMGLDPGEERDIEEYALFAYPRDDLKTMNAAFPKGTLLQAEGIHERVVHPLYQLRPDGQGFVPPDAGKMVKVAITITTQREKKR
jgi:hypothetical protein